MPPPTRRRVLGVDRPGASVALLALALLAALAAASCGGPRHTAAPAAPTVWRLAGGEVRSHELALDAGEYAHVVVDQRGIDVLVRLYDPAGTLLTEVDSPNGTDGPEPLSAIAGRAGTFRLEVRSLEAAADPGDYALSVETRPARPADRQRVAAEYAYADAGRLRRSGQAADLESALRLYDQAIEGWRSLDEPAPLAQALRWSAEVMLRRGGPDDVERALGRFHRALELLAGTGEPRDQAIVENRVAAVERRRGNLKVAAMHQRRAVERFRAAGDRDDLAAARANLGIIERGLGDYAAALEIYQEILDEQEGSGDRKGEAVARVDFGYLMLDLGRADLAEGAFRRAEEIYAELDLPAERVVARKGMADAAYQDGRLDEALELLEGALAERRRHGTPREQATVLNSLGNVRWKRREPRAAESAYRAALGLLTGSGLRRDQAVGRLGLARVLDSQRPAEALKLYRQALETFEATGDRRGAAACRLGMARALGESRRFAAALEESDHALAAVRDLRRELPGLTTGAAYRSFRQEYFELQIDLLMRRAREEPKAGFEVLAFEAAERGRAEGLRDLLAASRIAVPPAPASPLAADRDRVRREVEALAADSGRPANGTGDRLSRLLLRLDDLEARLDAERRIDETAPETLDLKAIQRQVLDDDTLLLTYALGERQSYLWLLSSTELAAYELAPRRRVEELVRQALRRLQSPSRADQELARKPLAELSNLLLAPVAGRLTTRRLLVVADGALHLLPFAALPDPSWAGDGPAPPLLAAHEVVSVPSASTVATLRRRLAHRPPAPGLLAVVADPVYTHDDPRLVAALGSAVGRSASAPAAFRRLAGSAAEARAISALVRPDRCFLAEGWDADRQRILAGALTGYRIVHFATHGIVDRRHPEVSGLVLSLVDRNGKPIRGFLRSYEVASLDLPADLVVLSACESGVGEELRGEGVVGLAHSFMRAGAARVVVSLWRVGDQATRELMVRFYEALLDQHLPPGAALRQAQLGLARDPRWSSPYDWAGFVLQGDWRSFTLPREE